MAMSNTSLAAQAVIGGPQTAAPPSFDGHGWLVVVNLTVFTAGFYLLVALGLWLVGQWWRYRHIDRWRDPVTIYRRIALAWAIGFALRCFGEAYSIWAWNPADPAATGAALHLKRFLDPIGAGFGFAGIFQLALTLRGMTPQLRKRPFPVDMWVSLPMMKRPALVVILCFVGAVGVTLTR